ncbi:CAP domain-containing protein [Streptomyces sp. NPDC002073]
MGRHRSTAPRPGKRTAPVRTGLLGVTAAAALGVAAVASGLVPVGDNFVLGGSSSDAAPKVKVEAKASPAAERVNGGLKSLTDSSASGSSGGGGGTGRASAGASKSASASPSPSASAPASAKPKVSASAKASPTLKPKPEPKPSVQKTVERTTPAPEPTTTPERPATSGGESAAEAAVLALVNQERARAGCRPVRQNPPLATLAGAFSKDMADRGFFDHTDPDGATPWDRASNAGISGLGGENIARGQADAEAVMASWMNSPGHRANILNCEFRTLGVGTHFAAGGPWWTQDFGF